MNSIKLKFWRNAVLYKDIRINIGEGISFSVYGEDGFPITSFNVDTVLYGGFSRIQVSYMKHYPGFATANAGGFSPRTERFSMSHTDDGLRR